MTASERSSDAASRESSATRSAAARTLGAAGETTLGDGAVAPRDAVRIPRAGDAIGRYRILAHVGHGAMGTVFAAYDPQLDRRIALKLLGSAHGDRAGLAEARALARLAHPNVVAVYDAGNIDGHAFIAMEYVVGRTLAEWLAVATRSSREIVAMFLETGRGLAAAHAAGIVHRDFKPANVLVGDDGRPRVVDFGLAHASDAAPDHERGRPAGTPLYMAPELFAGVAATAQSDGFAFAVALWDALFGAPPFRADTVTNLVSSMHEPLRPAKRRTDVPGHVEEALRRELRADPAERFASTELLLDALAPVRRRAPLVVAGVLALVGVGAWATRDDVAAACDTQWRADAQQRIAGVGDAIGALTIPAAESTSRAATRALGEFDAAHGVAKAEVCRLAVEDPLAAARASACIDARRREAEAIVEVLAVPDVDVAMAVPALLATLDDPGECLDPVIAARDAPPDLDPLTLARAEPIRRVLADAFALAKAGRAEAGAARLDGIAAEVEALDDAAVRGETAFVRATVLDDLGRIDESATALHDAIAWATRGGDRRTVARAWIELVFVEGYLREDVEAAALAIRLSEAELEAQGDDPSLAAHRQARVGVALFARGEIVAAQATLRDAVDRMHALGLELDAATVLMNLVAIASVAGGHADAETWIAEVEAIWTAQLPEGHPDFSRIHEARAQLAELRGDGATRVRELESAHRMRTAAIGGLHHETVLLEALLAEANLARGDDVAATTWAERATTHAQHTDRRSVRLTAARAMAEVLQQTGRLDEAARWIDEAMTLAATELPADSPQLAALLEARADVALARGDHAAALTDYERVLVDVKALWGPKHPFVAGSYGDIARAQVGAGRRDEARAALDSAIEVLASEDDVAPAHRLTAMVEVAQALWLVGDGARARAMVVAARAFAAARGSGDTIVIGALDELDAEIRRGGGGSAPTSTRPGDHAAD